MLTQIGDHSGAWRSSVTAFSSWPEEGTLPMSRPTFTTLKRVLLDLGFQTRILPGLHVMFEHQSSDTLVILRPYRDDEVIEQGTLAGIRRLLDEKGVIDRSRLDELLREQSLAG